MEWISVDERLPKVGVKVIVLGIDGSQEIKHLGEYKVSMILEDGSREDTISYSWDNGGWGIGWTSHWQPLPQPPKQEES